MIAADTNIALRLILQDDRSQLASIEAALTEQRLYLPLTVVLETGWVLASRYHMSRADIAEALSALSALSGVEVARVDLVMWAIERFRRGADWADMVHLVAARKLGGLLTFDRKLARHAGDTPPARVETLP